MAFVFSNSVLKAPGGASVDYNESAPYLCYDPNVSQDEYLANQEKAWPCRNIKRI